MCGILKKWMYGTRDAAHNWEHEYKEFVEAERFIVGKASPCVFRHPERRIRAVIHGDDFTLLGYPSELDWFRERINEKFEVKFGGRLGPQEEDDKHIRILNHVIKWTDYYGIEYDSDPRHSQLIIREDWSWRELAMELPPQPFKWN